MGCRFGSFEASALIDGYIDKNSAFFHCLEHVFGDKFGRFCSGNKNRAYDDIRQALENGDGRITVRVIYNFPDEFVRRNEIQLNEPARQAEIQITPVSPEPASQ